MGGRSLMPEVCGHTSVIVALSSGKGIGGEYKFFRNTIYMWLSNIQTNKGLLFVQMCVRRSQIING